MASAVFKYILVAVGVGHHDCSRWVTLETLGAISVMGKQLSQFWKLPGFVHLHSLCLVFATFCSQLQRSHKGLCSQHTYTAQPPDFRSTRVAYSCVHHSNGQTPCWYLHAYPDFIFDFQRCILHPTGFSIIFDCVLSTSSPRVHFLTSCSSLLFSALQQQRAQLNFAFQILAQFLFCIPLSLWSHLQPISSFEYLLWTSLPLHSNRHCP